MYDLLRLVVGLVLVFNGRRMIWLAVGAIGFLVGLAVSTTLLKQQDPLLAVSIGLVIGLLAGGLAQALGKTAVAIAGLLAGGVGGMLLLNTLNWHDRTAWLAFGFGGLLGLILVVWLFDWAMILISAWVGALFIVDGFDLTGQAAALLFVGLLLVGALAQMRWMGEPEKKKD